MSDPGVTKITREQLLEWAADQVEKGHPLYGYPQEEMEEILRLVKQRSASLWESKIPKWKKQRDRKQKG